MNKKVFNILFFTILLVAFLIRVLPLLNNNFYFTQDQGNDAVYVREILERGQFLLRGPETDISGLYQGPLWYYFIAIGYKIFDGHPLGALFMLIFLNVLATGILVLTISKNVSKSWALIIGGTLQISWWFYDTSRYAFNPFVLVFLSFILILALVDFTNGKIKSYILAGIPLGFAFHTEIAGATALAIFYFLIGFIFILKKRIPSSILLFGIGIVCLFFIPHVISEVKEGFTQIYSFLREFRQPEGAFSNFQFPTVTKYLLEQVSKSTFYQKQEVGIVLFFAIVGLTIKNLTQGKKTNKFVISFASLTGLLLIVVWIFFSSNNGWRDWQTAYVYPLVFVSVLLLLSQFKKEIAFIMLILIFSSHAITFVKRYEESVKISGDPSIMANQIAAIDWTYQKSDGKGFNVYSYLPSGVDYPYQYLFWWYGRRKYSYVPCDYSSLPGSPKPFYIPGSIYYDNPKKECTKFRFLIIEPDNNTGIREQWLKGTRERTELLEETSIGKIRIEKRILLQAIQ